jgi:hypothetical protein
MPNRFFQKSLFFFSASSILGDAILFLFHLVGLIVKMFSEPSSKRDIAGFIILILKTLNGQVGVLWS